MPTRPTRAGSCRSSAVADRSRKSTSGRFASSPTRRRSRSHRMSPRPSRKPSGLPIAKIRRFASRPAIRLGAHPGRAVTNPPRVPAASTATPVRRPRHGSAVFTGGHLRADRGIGRRDHLATAARRDLLADGPSTDPVPTRAPGVRAHSVARRAVTRTAAAQLRKGPADAPRRPKRDPTGATIMRGVLLDRVRPTLRARPRLRADRRAPAVARGGVAERTPRIAVDSAVVQGPPRAARRDCAP